MKKLSEALTYFSSLPKDKPTLKAWKDSGFLDYIPTEGLELKIIKAFDLAVKIMVEEFAGENRYIDKLDCYAIPSIRRLFFKSSLPDLDYSFPCVYDEFDFDEEKMKKFLQYLNDCFDYKKIEKHLNPEVIDVEAELLVFLTNIYVGYLNGTYKKQQNQK